MNDWKERFTTLGLRVQKEQLAKEIEAENAKRNQAGTTTTTEEQAGTTAIIPPPDSRAASVVVAQVVGKMMTKVHRGNYLTLPEPVVTLKDEVMNRLDQFVHELKTEFPMLSAYDFTLNAVVPTGEQTKIRKPMNKTIRIVLDRANSQSETDFLKSVEEAQASVTMHGGTILGVERHPEQGEARRYELATSFEEVSSRAQAERIRDTIDKEFGCQHGVYLEE